MRVYRRTTRVWLLPWSASNACTTRLKNVGLCLAILLKEFITVIKLILQYKTPTSSWVTTNTLHVITPLQTYPCNVFHDYFMYMLKNESSLNLKHFVCQQQLLCFLISPNLTVIYWKYLWVRVEWLFKCDSALQINVR